MYYNKLLNLFVSLSLVIQLLHIVSSLIVNCSFTHLFESKKLSIMIFKRCYLFTHMFANVIFSYFAKYFIISAIKLVFNINVLKVDIEMTPNMAWEEVNVIEKTCNSLHLFCRLIFNESNFLPYHLFYNTLIK